MVEIDKNKAGVSMVCEGQCNAGIASAANCKLTKHVRMCRVSRFGYERIAVCTICEAVTNI